MQDAEADVDTKVTMVAPCNAVQTRYRNLSPLCLKLCNNIFVIQRETERMIRIPYLHLSLTGSISLLDEGFEAPLVFPLSISPKSPIIILVVSMG